MDMDDAVDIYAETFDEQLFALRHRGLKNSYDQFDTQHAFSIFLSMIDELPKPSWTPDRVKATLSVLYDVANEISAEREWSIYELLNGKAPARLLKAHLKDLEETLEAGSTQQSYYHFVHHPGLIRDLVSWRQGKRPKPLDSTTWKAGLHPHHKHIDWSQAKDPVATLLTLRAAYPYADVGTKKSWWDSMLAHETRSGWTGSLRHSTLVAALEDSDFLSSELLDRYLSKCLVDLDFIERLPDLETSIDIYERPRTLGQMRNFWLQLRIRRLDLVESVDGEDIEVRKRKRYLVSTYNKVLSTSTDVESLLTCLSLIFKQDSPVEQELSPGMSSAWATILSTKVSTKEKDTLQLVFDDIDSLEVARHFVENTTVKQHASTVGLPEDLIQDFVFPVT